MGEDEGSGGVRIEDEAGDEDTAVGTEDICDEDTSPNQAMDQQQQQQSASSSMDDKPAAEARSEAKMDPQDGDSNQETAQIDKQALQAASNEGLTSFGHWTSDHGLSVFLNDKEGQEAVQQQKRPSSAGALDNQNQSTGTRSNLAQFSRNQAGDLFKQVQN